MADPLARFWVHSTSVERFAGPGPDGDTFDAPVTVVGFVQQQTRLVRNDQGVEVVSRTTVFYPRDTAAIPAGSVITEPLSGLPAKVIMCAIQDAGALPLPEHVEVACE